MHLSLAHVATIVAIATVIITTVQAENIATATSSCVTDYLGTSTTLRFVPLAEIVECFRTTPMDPSIAYNLVEYAQYAYELHTVRAYARNASAVKARFEGLFDLFSPTTTSMATASFSAAATGISEFDFHVLLSNAFDAMQDYHFGLIPYHILGTTFLSRPFVFGSRYNTATSTQELFARSTSLVLEYWVRYFASQSVVIPNPLDTSFDFTGMVAAIRRVAQAQLTITSINGLDPIEQYMQQLWRVTSNMADDHCALNDLVDFNMNPTLIGVPPQYFLRSTSRVFAQASQGPNLTFFADRLYTYNSSLPSLDATSGAYYEDYTFSDGTTIRVPMLVDLRNTASVPSCSSSGLSTQDDYDEVRTDETATEALSGQPSSSSTATYVHLAPLLENAPTSLTLAMRQPRLHGEELYRMSPTDCPYSTDTAGSSSPRQASRRRRRMDPYLAYSDDTVNSLAHRVYSSRVINGYYVGVNRSSSLSAEQTSLMILRIKSFAGSSYSATLSSFVDCINAVLLAAEGDRASNLLIDVRRNGGGYVQAQMVLLSILDYDTFQKFFVTRTYTSVSRYSGLSVVGIAPANGTFDNSSTMVYSVDVSSKILYNASQSPNPSLATGAYYDAIGLAFYADLLNGTSNKTEFLNNLTYSDDPVTRAWYYNVNGVAGIDGLTPEFSTPLRVSRALTFPSDWSGWRNVTLVTDGACGSACSMFESRLVDHLPRSSYTVTSVGFGGLVAGSRTGAVMQSSQFTGGSVLTMNCDASLFSNPNYDFVGRKTSSTTAPYYPITFRFTSWHWLSDPDNIDAPRQYVNHPVDHQRMEWDVTIEDVVLNVYGGNVIMRSAASDVFRGGSVVALVLITAQLLVLLDRML
jgi:hypothetical protein